MLSTGMRAPMGLKIYGPDLETIEQSGKAIEQALKDCLLYTSDAADEL